MLDAVYRTQIEDISWPAGTGCIVGASFGDPTDDVYVASVYFSFGGRTEVLLKDVRS
jgi:hypothetical protein